MYIFMIFLIKGRSIMEINKVSEACLEACFAIAKKQYLKECESVEELFEENYEIELYHRLKLHCTKGHGIVCFDGAQVCGYIITDREIENDTFDYISIPVWGYGVEQVNRSKIMCFMFQILASRTMAINNKVQFNVKIYAHDKEVLSYFVLCQFGILCTDAISRTANNIVEISEINYKELSKKDILHRRADILTLYRSLVKHLQQSPIFYPGKEFTDEVYLQYIFSDTTRLFAAFNEDEIIGMMDASVDKECFLLNNDTIYNVGDLFVQEAYRGKKIAQSLLEYVRSTLFEEGVKKLWVEHGTANPNATGFWDKYFKNYTYTLVRDIMSS